VATPVEEIEGILASSALKASSDTLQNECTGLIQGL